MSFRAHGRAKVINDHELGDLKFDEIDFLKVHTADEDSSDNSG